VTAQFDLVIIDTPAVSVVADAIPLVRQVSGVVIVSRIGKTRCDAATRLGEELRQLEAPTLGIVANGAPAKQRSYENRGYDSFRSAKPTWNGEGNSRRGKFRVPTSIRQRVRARATTAEARREPNRDYGPPDAAPEAHELPRGASLAPRHSQPRAPLELPGPDESHRPGLTHQKPGVKHSSPAAGLVVSDISTGPTQRTDR